MLCATYILLLTIHFYTVQDLLLTVVIDHTVREIPDSAERSFLLGLGPKQHTMYEMEAMECSTLESHHGVPRMRILRVIETTTVT